MTHALSTPLMYLKGVGPARAAMLEGKGLKTVEDLLAYPPFRYEDRSNVKTIAQLAPGEMATVIAEVESARLAGFRRRNLGLFEAVFTDASRATLVGKWFHGGYLEKVIEPGQRVALYGKVEFDSYSGELSMLHPEFEILGRRRGRRACTPGGSYPSTRPPGRSLPACSARLLWQVLEELPPAPDPLPEASATSSNCRTCGPRSATCTSRPRARTSGC